MGTLGRKTNGNSQETGEQKIKKLGVSYFAEPGGKNERNRHKLCVLFSLWMFTFRHLMALPPRLKDTYSIVFCI